MKNCCGLLKIRVNWNQRHDYADEKRAALQAWARHVLALVEGKPDNVVRLEGVR